MSTDILTDRQKTDIRESFASQFYGDSNHNAGIVHLYRQDDTHYLFGRATSKVIAEKEITNYAEVDNDVIRHEIRAFKEEFVKMNAKGAFFTKMTVDKKWEFSLKGLMAFMPVPIDTFLFHGFGDAYMKKGRNCWDVFLRGADKDYLVAAGDTRRHAIDLAMVWATSAKPSAIQSVKAYIEAGRSIDKMQYMWPPLHAFAVAYCESAGIKPVPTFAVLPNRPNGWTSCRIASEEEVSVDFDSARVGDQIDWAGSTATIVAKGTDLEMRDFAEELDRAVVQQRKFEEAVEGEKKAKEWKWTQHEHLQKSLDRLTEDQSAALACWNRVVNPLNCE